MRFRLALLVTSMLAMAACAGSPTAATSTSTTTTPVVTAHGSMSATIDGTRWDASAALLATQQTGIVAVTGADAFSNYTTVTFGVPATVGTYQVGMLTLANAHVDFTTTTGESAWTSILAGSSGTVTLATLTATGATGTFSFSLVPLGAPATGTKVVTNGVFNVTF